MTVPFAGGLLGDAEQHRDLAPAAPAATRRSYSVGKLASRGGRVAEGQADAAKIPALWAKIRAQPRRPRSASPPFRGVLASASGTVIDDARPTSVEAERLARPCRPVRRPLRGDPPRRGPAGPGRGGDGDAAAVVVAPHAPPGIRMPIRRARVRLAPRPDDPRTRSPAPTGSSPRCGRRSASSPRLPTKAPTRMRGGRREGRPAGRWGVAAASATSCSRRQRRSPAHLDVRAVAVFSSVARGFEVDGTGAISGARARVGRWGLQSTRW